MKASAIFSVIPVLFLLPALGLSAQPSNVDLPADGPAHAVLDIATSAAQDNPNPSWLTVMNGIAYYAAQDEQHGYELWRTDGTTEGTWLVRDIQPGPGSSTPTLLTAVGNRLYFVASDGARNVGVWVTDGTAVGTRRLGPARQSQLGSGFPLKAPEYLTAGASGLLMTVGTRLDAADEVGGIRRLRNLCEGDGEPALLPLVGSTSMAGQTYLLTSCLSEQRLWRTDGTVSGTQLVRAGPLVEGGDQAQIRPEIVAVGNTLFFSAADPKHGTTLWRSDGTNAGTAQVVEFGDSNPRWLTPVGTRLAFTTGQWYLLPTTLWFTDGTEAGTVSVTSGAQPHGLTAFGDSVMFVASDSGGGRLWRSDGTPAGTVALGRVGSGDVLVKVGSRLFAWNPSGDSTKPGLWVIDESGIDTRRVLGFDSPPCPGAFVSLNISPDRVTPYLCGPQLTALNDTLLFRVPGPVLANARAHDLWRSDGTPAGTQRLAHTAHTRSSRPIRLTAQGSDVFFTVERRYNPFDPQYDPRQLWKSDGTLAGTALVREWPVPHVCCEHWSGIWLDDIKSLTSSGERLFFSLTSDDACNLWASDGTSGGTIPVGDFYRPGAFLCGLPAVQLGNQEPTPPYWWNGRAFFAASTDAAGLELWASDGTPTGTQLLADLCPGTCDSWPTQFWGFDINHVGPQFAVVQDGVFFTTGAPNGGALWRTHGTAATTTLIKNVSVNQIVSLGNMLYFVGQTGANDFGLWHSDGTSQATSLIVPLARGASFLTVVGSQLFFEADFPGGSRPVLWRSDGTLAGTAPLIGGPSGRPDDPDSLTAIGSLLFFSARGSTGRELWRSDGTVAGTFQVADIAPGGGSAIEEGAPFVVADGRLFFPASSPGLGRELWSSDGTALGTQLVQDVALGPASSDPGELTLAGTNLFFTADDGTTGVELWALPLTGSSITAKRR